MPQDLVPVKGFVAINCAYVTSLQTTAVFGIMEKMQKLGMATALLSGLFLVGCGTSTPGPTGSFHQTQTGVSETGYPGTPAQNNDAQSPALSASTETKYSQAIAEPTASKESAQDETTIAPKTAAPKPIAPK